MEGWGCCGGGRETCAFWRSLRSCSSLASAACWRSCLVMKTGFAASSLLFFSSHSLSSIDTGSPALLPPLDPASAAVSFERCGLTARGASLISTCAPRRHQMPTFDLFLWCWCLRSCNIPAPPPIPLFSPPTLSTLSPITLLPYCPHSLQGAGTGTGTLCLWHTVITRRSFRFSQHVECEATREQPNRHVVLYLN